MSEKTPIVGSYWKRKNGHRYTLKVTKVIHNRVYYDFYGGCITPGRYIDVIRSSDPLYIFKTYNTLLIVDEI